MTSSMYVLSIFVVGGKGSLSLVLSLFAHAQLRLSKKMQKSFMEKTQFFGFRNCESFKV